jgi:5-oxoprolinase (ATP-hydrolysing) subunit A
MTPTVDLIADIGEGFGAYRMGDDSQILQAVTSANVACGFHAGDPRTMRDSVRDCLARGVGVGAHPAFPDLVGFGRREIDQTADETMTDVLYQMGALAGFVRAAGGSLTHVTPHGRLGNLATTDEGVATAIAEAVEAFDPTLIVVTYRGALERIATERGLPVALLGFPDRAYEDDGSLVSRRDPDALIHDPDEIARRAVEMATTGRITSRHGNPVELGAHSLLLHGDNQASVDAALRVRRELERSGVRIAPLCEVVGHRAGPA